MSDAREAPILLQPKAAGIVEERPDPGYSPPRDPLSAAALERWRDHKFGIIIHWGLYTGLGFDGSWTLCRTNDEASMLLPDWFDGDEDAWSAFYAQSRRSFDPSSFDAEEWATASAGAGARYVIVTSKHHDGFSMYDTAQSDYRITAADVPFGRDALRETFDAFRDAGLETGVYFSKADWHHPGYWSPEESIVDRFHNYDIAAHPNRWEEFRRFTAAQIDELLTDYGDINVLWLDAGWVHAPEEDLRMPELAERARALQPGILVVDREVHGPQEDYRTPEQRVPESRLDWPWESCVTLSDTWCATTEDETDAKTPEEIVDMLVHVVARGGNLLLGIGPDRNGAMPPSYARVLAGVGAWLESNGAAIFGTRPVPREWIRGNGGRESLDAAGRTWWLTSHDGRLHLIDLDRGNTSPHSLVVPLDPALTVTRCTMAGVDVGWRQGADGAVSIDLPGRSGGTGQLSLDFTTR
ncbi:alpha-L-fucosidase [Microbacterium sp. MYb62]|uniref:alpha-L-fucosidase n=1 Tax=Microbacterium sp. MYb62 TaxID=1848690 RepID=UPI000CFAA6E9|nr:alpha-L-fucosidase [Microbacterium sp. MYb62]PRB09220.1 glycosyl hydrolase [Microbacterium sp. MYb62]